MTNAKHFRMSKRQQPLKYRRRDQWEDWKLSEKTVELSWGEGGGLDGFGRTVRFLRFILALSETYPEKNKKNNNNPEGVSDVPDFSGNHAPGPLTSRNSGRSQSLHKGQGRIYPNLTANIRYKPEAFSHYRAIFSHLSVLSSLRPFPDKSSRHTQQTCQLRQ